MSYYLIILDETEIHTIYILPIIGVYCIFSSTYNEKDVTNIIKNYFKYVFIVTTVYFFTFQIISFFLKKS